MVQACQVLRAAGATKVGSNYPGDTWKATGDAAADDAAFDNLLETVVAKGGFCFCSCHANYVRHHLCSVPSKHVTCATSVLARVLH